MTAIDIQEEELNAIEEAVELTGYDKFKFNIERAKELAEKIATKALDELALRESMGEDLDGLVENLEEQDLKLFGAPEIEEELEPIQDLDPSHPDYIQPPIQ